MFKNWFGKKKNKEEPASTDKYTINKGENIPAQKKSNSLYKVVRDISDNLSQKLESSTIPLWIGQLYMHYWNKNTLEDLNNPEWQNQGMFFWRIEEPFPNKSLPPSFELMDKRIFRITHEVRIFQGTAMPWFGMPGGGLKMGFGDQNTPIPIKEMQNKDIIEYIELVELSEENTDILYDRERYTLIAGGNITYEDNTFYLDGAPVSLSTAYSAGVIHVGKVVNY
ncbi:DUF4237 domain-containing protein [Dysgonomonas sp. 521]|uniref:glycohydrolase toxin TNT-related protein n=1 Tax=Dysgonomonas sp. 521 TaxID=2302932 RepID=UPI0013D7DC8E|nr:glycohydrolase toxin TNT-related protein [Dysgonomonas sp. 521]NDV95320.1 DUF4237 domain-containing protein [Dysgonomonas sp. 521]